MPAYRGKMFFSQGGSGWTDEIFVMGSTMQTAFADLRLLAEVRAGCLGSGAEMVSCELSNPRVFGQTIASGVKTPPIPLPAGNPFDGLLLQMQAGGTGTKPAYRRTWLMRSLPAGYRFTGTNPIAGTFAPVNARLAAFLQVLCNGRYFLQVADKETGWHKIADMIPFAVTNMSLDGKPMDPAQAGSSATAFVVLLGDNASIPAVDPETEQASRVFLRDVRWTSPAAGRAAQITGEKAVLATAPGLVVVRADTPTSGKFAGKGWLTLRHMVYEPIKAVVGIGQSQRKCGAPVSRSRLAARDLAPTTISVTPTNPIPPQQPTEPGDFSETTEIKNARDLIKQIYKGYDPDADGKINPVRIAPIRGFTNNYLVLCSGTDLGTGSATGIPQDIAAALSLPSSFTAGLADAIVDATQPGATLVLAGHSLGGMVLQNAIWWGIPGDKTVSHCITYGSPLTIFQARNPAYRMFFLPGDKVPSLSVLSFLLGSALDAYFTQLDPGDIPLGPVSRHTHYQDCLDLENYSPLGDKLAPGQTFPITVGKWKSYPLPRLTI